TASRFRSSVIGTGSGSLVERTLRANQRSRRLRSANSVTPAHRRYVAHDLFAAFAGANPDGLLDRPHEDAPVAGLARIGGADDRLDSLVDHVIGKHALDLDLREQADVRARPAVLLGVALLPPAAHHLGDGQPARAKLVECVLDRLQPL